MILLCNLLAAIGQLLDAVIDVFILLLIVRALLSWVNPDPSNFIVQFLYSSTEPILTPVRKRMPPLGMLDLSVIVVIFGFYFLDAFLVRSIMDYAIICKGSISQTIGG